ncbi:MAG TPA: 30S ribosome-binding factor RbfA [Acidimicrobiia bacterium]
MTKHGSPRKYPRMARVNEVVRETLGDELERLSDPRLGLVTITGVDVSADLRQATVYYSALGRSGKRRTGVVAELAPEQREATDAALRSAAPHLRAELGRQVRLKYLPQLTFIEDPAIATGNRIEEILRDLHREADPEAGPTTEGEPGEMEPGGIKPVEGEPVEGEP